MNKLSVVVGGAGALGREMIKSLKNTGFKTISIDYVKNDDAGLNLLLDSTKLLKDQSKSINAKVMEEALKSPLNGICCTAGGWAGGSIGADNFLEGISQMHDMNLMSAALTAHLAVNNIAQDGVLVLTGSEPALRPTPGMIGYGISKNSTHYLVKSLASDPQFMAKKAVVYGFLPITIDTPLNRKFNPDADYTKWVKVSLFSILLNNYLIMV